MLNCLLSFIYRYLCKKNNNSSDKSTSFAFYFRITVGVHFSTILRFHPLLILKTNEQLGIFHFKSSYMRDCRLIWERIKITTLNKVESRAELGYKYECWYKILSSINLRLILLFSICGGGGDKKVRDEYDLQGVPSLKLD